VRITKVLKNVGFAQVVKRDAKKEKQEQYQKQAEPEPEPEPEEHYEDSETFGDE